MKKGFVIAAVAVAVFCLSFVSPLRAEEIIEFEAYSESITAHAEKIVPNEDLTSKEEFFHFVREEFTNENFSRSVNFEETRATVIKGSLGWITGFMFHELGHITVANIGNVEIEYNFHNAIDPRMTYISDDYNKLKKIHSAGFVAELISAEIILGVEKIPKDDAFFLGWLAFDIFNPFIYALKDGVLCDGGYGDMKSLRKKGLNTDFLKIGMIVHSIFIAYRLGEVRAKSSSKLPYIDVVNDGETTAMLAIWKW